jgi:hypothetical protein
MRFVATFNNDQAQFDKIKIYAVFQQFCLDVKDITKKDVDMKTHGCSITVEYVNFLELESVVENLQNVINMVLFCELI